MEKSSNEMIINEKENKKHRRILSGKRLRSICESKGLKQKDIAEITGSYTQLINNIYQGVRSLPREKAEVLCDFFRQKYNQNINIEWLLGFDVWNKEEAEFLNDFMIDKLNFVMASYDITFDKEKALYIIKDYYGYTAAASIEQMQFFLSSVRNMNRVLSRQFFVSINNNASETYNNQNAKIDETLWKNGLIDMSEYSTLLS